MLNLPSIELTRNNAIIFTAYMPFFKKHLKELWNPLSPQEKSQANKFINENLKNKYIISHGILKYLLSRYLNITPSDIHYITNQFGKPFIDNPHCQLQFNMSHSKDYVVYIISLDNHVGIDIEWKDKDINLDEIYPLVLSAIEKKIYSQLNKEEQFITFYDTWTKKESLIKAIGCGLSYPLQDIEILHSSQNDHAYIIVNNIPLYYSHFCKIEGYAGAVSFNHKVCNCIQIDLNTL